MSMVLPISPSEFRKNGQLTRKSGKQYTKIIEKAYDLPHVFLQQDWFM
jgi:hypothetical protein